MILLQKGIVDLTKPNATTWILIDQRSLESLLYLYRTVV